MGTTTYEEYAKMTKKELAIMCSECGLNRSGSKKELLARILDTMEW